MSPGLEFTCEVGMRLGDLEVVDAGGRSIDFNRRHRQGAQVLVVDGVPGAMLPAAFPASPTKPLAHNLQKVSLDSQNVYLLDTIFDN